MSVDEALLMELADCGSPERLLGVIFAHRADWRPPVDVETFARSVGIIDFMDLEVDGFVGALQTDMEKTKGIILSATGMPVRRRRFTVAHELGHFLIAAHRGDKRCTAKDLLETRRETSHQKEAQAKRLRSHGLIQAYSRANRILNSVKTYGNIVCFRDLEQETNDALALFGNKDAKGIVLLKPYGDYYGEYESRVADLQGGFALGSQIVGESAKKAFIRLFSSILRLRNILTAFDDFSGNEILSAREFQDYLSIYLNLYAEFRTGSEADKEAINDDIVFEIELVKQVEINVDYILLLVERYLATKGTGEDKEIRATIERAIDSSPSLRNKKDLIEQFVDSVSNEAKVDAQWGAFVAAKRVEELDRIIADEGLNAAATQSFVEDAFRDGAIATTGVAITRIMPPVSRFAKGGGHAAKKATVISRLSEFFDRYFGLS